MKKITRILGVTTMIILILSLTGCYYDELVERELPANTNVSFATDIQPIFNNDCIACHNGTLDPDLREGFSYDFMTITDPGLIVPNDADGSELYQRLFGIGGGLMPPGGSLSDIDISLIEAWINQGALNN